MCRSYHILSVTASNIQHVGTSGLGKVNLDSETLNRSLTFNRYLGDFESGTCRGITWKERKRKWDRKEVKRLKFIFKRFHCINQDEISFFFFLPLHRPSNLTMDKDTITFTRNDFSQIL